ncbi:hypothetical protein H4F05_09345 [Vibrio cholerae]
MQTLTNMLKASLIGTLVLSARVLMVATVLLLFVSKVLLALSMLSTQ